MLSENYNWIRKPEKTKILNGIVEIYTNPHTDLWQRTYYNFQNDNAPIFYREVEEEYFSFTVKAEFRDAKHRFDQCGLVIYQDSENWLKASSEYENGDYQHLGCVVTNSGYSDWSTMEIDPSIKEIWYRVSRRESDFRVEYSSDGKIFHQMRICHLNKGGGKVNIGIYACSPEESSFKASFSNFKFSECLWGDHVGQVPD